MLGNLWLIFFSFFFLDASCKDDNTWKDDKYGDGLGYCAVMTSNWCKNFGDYSNEAQTACPKTCGCC